MALFRQVRVKASKTNKTPLCPHLFGRLYFASCRNNINSSNKPFCLLLAYRPVTWPDLVAHSDQKGWDIVLIPLSKVSHKKVPPCQYLPAMWLVHQTMPFHLRTLWRISNFRLQTRVTSAGSQPYPPSYSIENSSINYQT